MDKPELYFPRDVEWYDWLLQNHDKYSGAYLIFYKLETGIPSMRWEEAVKVALCFGWIDSTVKSLGNGKRIQYFSPRNPKSTWSSSGVCFPSASSFSIRSVSGASPSNLRLSRLMWLSMVRSLT